VPLFDLQTAIDPLRSEETRKLSWRTSSATASPSRDPARDPLARAAGRVALLWAVKCDGPALSSHHGLVPLLADVSR